MDNEHSTIKKLAVVFEELFKRTNELPPDPDMMKNRSTIYPGTRGFSTDVGKVEKDEKRAGQQQHRWMRVSPS